MTHPLLGARLSWAPPLPEHAASVRSQRVSGLSRALLAPTELPPQHLPPLSLGTRNQVPGHFQAQRLPSAATETMFLPKVRQGFISI